MLIPPNKYPEQLVRVVGESWRHLAGRVKSLAASYEDSIGAENIIERRV